MTSDVTDVVRALRERLAALEADRSPSDPTDATPRSGGPDGTAAGSGVESSGAELSEEERAEETQAKNICLRLLADSARPRAGLAQKLAQRGIGPATIERVLDRFTEVGLIDDQAYAEAYVRTKHQERALSRRALTSELRRKGVDDSVVAAAAEQVDPDAEEAAALRLITKRAPAALAAGPEAARRRLLALLDRRGYPAEVSIRVVETVLARQDE
ncbi:regulatory protein RecX [Nakamurella deserti]|uniref:regulatory protein RecX n=1 Tax=Nakamurella deserti TaxID=2164074 RepID=UPI000DBEA7E1|nr:regulatory protein RecX [Nakamurella deserti]